MSAKVKYESRNRATETLFFISPIDALDNFSAHAIRIWGRVFPTAEHAYQWKQFASSSPEIAQRIIAAPSAHMAKSIASQNKSKLRKEWAVNKVAVMKKILRTKAAQHADVWEVLKETKHKLIVENSPVDEFWGDGPRGQGQNMVGKIWMGIRDSRRQLT